MAGDKENDAGDVAVGPKVTTVSDNEENPFRYYSILIMQTLKHNDFPRFI